MIRIRRARRDDSAAIGRVHVETWQSTYAGLLPDRLLAAMSDVRQSAWWSRLLAERREAGATLIDLTEANPTLVGLGGAGPDDLAAPAGTGSVGIRAAAGAGRGAAVPSLPGLRMPPGRGRTTVESGGRKGSSVSDIPSEAAPQTTRTRTAPPR